MDLRPGFRGSLHGASTMTARPAELRTCYAASATSWMINPCGAAHRGEFLAERSVAGGGARGTAGDDGALLDSCRRVASRLIGAPVAADQRVQLTLRYLSSSRRRPHRAVRDRDHR